MEKVWKIKQPNLRLQSEISQALDISGVLAGILINRGITNSKEAQDFLASQLEQLHEPFLLKGMAEAIKRIRKAVDKHEKIMVWGDYDIDGITGCALLKSVLKEMGADVSHYLPNRLEEGYGLNKNGADLAHKKGINLLITVDCGVSSYQPISYLKKMGIETIVCDHHQPQQKDRLPDALAIINPLQKDCPYPYKYLSGVGVAAKLASALYADQKAVLDKHLDIIALGTVGDIVPLTGENRIFVKHGLAQLRQTKKLGLKALIEVSGLSNRQLNAGHIGYILGPRINATGRLGSPEDSLRLILSEKEEEALILARKLDKGNRIRQKIENQTLQEAISLVESQVNFKEDNIIVLAAPHWHQGVIGIVASRLVERYFRPTIMLKFTDDFARGSGRSLGEFHLLEAVTRCKDLLEEYGGHKRACGLKIKKKKFSEFLAMINQVAAQMFLPEDSVPSLDIDLQLPLSDLNVELIEELESLAPFGENNPRPLICSSGLKVRSRASLVSGSHIKFWVTDGRLTCEAIGYNKAGTFPLLSGGETVALAYSPSVSDWQGNFSIQLKIEDLKITS